MSKMRYIMIGGFLGAGKTTALLHFATYLRDKGLRAGLITNDQSIDLVDTARARAADHPVQEVTGGCFCCKFDHLMQAAETLANGCRLDALIAEPVGSCTDVRATVGYPMRRLFGDRYEVAPLSVVVDPQRCAEALDLESSAGFSEKVVYIYRKQLEEADAIVINKIDLLTPEFRQRLKTALNQNFPGTPLFEVSCQTGEGLARWFDYLLLETIDSRDSMEVDYDVYADGEALLGWLNARVAFMAKPPLNGNQLMCDLLLRLKKALAAREVEIAHAKVSIETGNPSEFGSVSVTSSSSEPMITWSSDGQISQGRLILNLRAETDPDTLRNEVMTALFTLPGVMTKIEEIAAFKPGRPTPTHRLATALA